MSFLNRLLAHLPGAVVHAAAEPRVPSSLEKKLKMDFSKLKAVPGQPGVYDYDGNIMWSDLGLQRFPIKLRNVHGNFNVYENNITTLVGGPVYVSGSYDCAGNSLRSLQGAPHEVGKDFHCEGNFLTSLEGAPKKMGGTFYCIGNDLPPSVDVPEGIREHLDARYRLFAPKSAPNPTHAAADAPAQGPARTFIDTLRRPANKTPINIGNGVSVRFRTNGALKAKPGQYTLKYTVLHNNDEIPDLELVLYVGVDDVAGLFQMRKLRIVSKEKEYKNTARDEILVLGSDPDEIHRDMKRLFSPGGELNRPALALYKQAMHHLDSRHVENEVSTEHTTPFDYAMEIRRGFGKAPVNVDVVTLVLGEVTALKANDDVVVKFNAAMPDLPENVKDLQLHLYITIDSLFGSALIRKIRFLSRSADYSDSDTQHQLSLDEDPGRAADDLRENLHGGPLGDVIREMALRATYSLKGGEKLGEEETPETEEEESKINWADLGLEDPFA